MAAGRVHVTSRKVDECAEERDEDIRAGVVAPFLLVFAWEVEAEAVAAR